MTATEDRMRQAFDKAMFHNSPTIMRVQIAADLADQMVAEATAELRKRHDEMLAALKALIRAADAMIDCNDGSEREYLCNEVSNARVVANRCAAAGVIKKMEQAS